MYYNKFQDLEISALGMGTMRLPVFDGDDSKIDVPTTKEMVKYALEHGINYFDTAWGYHSGHSEEAVGEVLADYDRSSFYLATKFPGYDVSNFGKHEEIFEKQLKKCQVDYFDFYLIHNVCEVNIEKYLDDEQYHTVTYFKQKRDEGKIKHLGFSTHANFDNFKRYMEKYGDDMEFCQIQLNYQDWDFQDAKLKYEYCKEAKIPVIVMEPLRGGNLCSLSDEHMERLKELDGGKKTATEWALRWLQGLDDVVTVLGGMSSPEQMKENIETFEQREPLDADQREVLQKIGYDMAYAKGLPCTACRYCVDHCPQGLDIPNLIFLYNEHLSRETGQFIAPMTYKSLPDDKKPDACIACNACHNVCPQALEIPEFLAEFAAAMNKKKD